MAEWTLPFLDRAQATGTFGVVAASHKLATQTAMGVLDMSFRPGDVQIINNNVVLHSRTAFVDHQDVGGRRLLLRVWTSHRSSRPLPKAFGDLYGLVDAGVYRGGVWPDGVFPTDAEEAALPHAPGSEKAHLTTSNPPERFGNSAQGRDPNAESHI